MAAYLLAAALAGGALAALLAVDGLASLGWALVWALPLSVVLAFVALSLYYLCRSQPFMAARWPRALGARATAVLLLSGMAVALASAWNAVGFILGHPAGFVTMNGPAWALLLLACLGLFSLSVLAHDVLIAVEAAHAAAAREAQARVLARDMELQLLRLQIDPHFLFNSLNSISALILDGRGEEAERMLARLSTFFRTTLAIDPLMDVRLDRELELHQRYLAIEQMRYPDLSVEIVLPDELRAAAVPALIIQPLVENAIKHGVALSPPPTRIAITAERIGETLAITVKDSGNPEMERRLSGSEGIGIANVRQRLAEYFGAAQSLVLTPAKGSFTARVTMPLAFAP